MSRKLELEGQTFGFWTVLNKTTSENRKSMWACQCKCGNISVVRGTDLTNGNSTSCGCSRITHGMTNTKEYSTWSEMKKRCTNPKHSTYHYYGGAGIKVCQQWLNSFEEFYNHIGPAPSAKASIDRIDNKKDYEPGNVRWVEDYSIQNINRKIPKHNTSGVKGVTWYAKYNKWMVRININKKRKNLGYYDTFEEAVNVRKKAEQEYYNVGT